MSKRRVTTDNAEWPTRVPVDVAPAIDTDMSFEDMLLRTKEILRREITHLTQESAEGKLGMNAAKDLVQYVRVLRDLAKQEAEQAQSLSEEQLKTALEKK